MMKSPKNPTGTILKIIFAYVSAPYYPTKAKIEPRKQNHNANACHMSKLQISNIQNGGHPSVNSSLKKWWNSHTVNNERKVWLWKALLGPVAMYGGESWTTKAADEEWINAFEMKGQRKNLESQDRKEKIWVLKKAGIKWDFWKQ